MIRFKIFSIILLKLLLLLVTINTSSISAYTPKVHINKSVRKLINSSKILCKLDSITNDKFSDLFALSKNLTNLKNRKKNWLKKELKKDKINKLTTENKILKLKNIYKSQIKELIDEKNILKGLSFNNKFKDISIAPKLKKLCSEVSIIPNKYLYLDSNRVLITVAKGKKRKYGIYLINIKNKKVKHIIFGNGKSEILGKLKNKNFDWILVKTKKERSNRSIELFRPIIYNKKDNKTSNKNILKSNSEEVFAIELIDYNNDNLTDLAFHINIEDNQTGLETILTKIFLYNDFSFNELLEEKKRNFNLIYYENKISISKENKDKISDIMELIYAFFSKDSYLKSNLKLKIKIFGNDEDYKAYQNKIAEIKASAGFYMHSKNEAVINGSLDKDQMLKTIIHEATHLIIHSLSRNVPEWIHEGLAESFENSYADNNKLRIKNNIGWLFTLNKSLKDKKLFTLSTLVNKKSFGWWKNLKQDDIAQFYALSWSVYYFLLQNSDNHKQIIDLFSYLRTTPKYDGKSLLNRLTGEKSVEEFEKRWIKFITKKINYQTITIDFTNVEKDRELLNSILYLKKAKYFLNLKKYVKAKVFLNRIIEETPKSKIGINAKKLLENIPNK